MTETIYPNIYVDGVDIYLKKKGRYHRLCQWVDNVGYYQVVFRVNGKKKYVRAHRLIAETLLPNPQKLPMINHIDGCKLNNKLENLEWCTNAYNTKQGYDNGAYYNKHRKHSIKVIDKNTKKEMIFMSIRSCAEYLKLNRKTITAILKRQKENHYPYEFEYLESVSTISDECKRVGLEISTNPERETATENSVVEDIVRLLGDKKVNPCRTANGWDINGFGQLKDGRGNICPVTIILPTLAMEAKESSTGDVVERFMKILDTTIHEAKDQLLERFEYICKQNPASAKFMYENGTMKGYIPEEGIRSALKHGTLAVGQLGLAEALEILIGCNHTKPEGMALAKRIEQLFKERCNEFKLEYKLNFGVYYSPAENLCFTAMKKFQQKYGVVPKVSDHDFFTNSMHVPVWEDVDVFQKIDIESQLTGYSSAGCITYVELPSSVQNNLDALETIVNYAMDKDVPYFAVNVPNDTCLDCGFTGEFNDCCPKCGSENIQQLRRVTGYLTGNYKTAFNKGKQQETEMRVKHVGKLEEAK